MVVLPIFFALAFTECGAALQPVMHALQQNDVGQAAVLLGDVPSECANSGEFYALSGITAELSGKTAESEADFLKAIFLDPKSARLKEQLGAAYLRNKKPEQAADILRQAVVLDPTNSAVKKFLIGADVETNSWTEAAELFDRLGEKVSASSDPILVLWLARTLIGTKQFGRLDRDLAAVTPGMPAALLFSLGTLCAEHGLYPRAAAYLRQIANKDADDAVYFNLGLVRSHLREYEEARKNYFLAIDKQPGQVEAYFRVGLDYDAAGEPRKGLPWLFRAHDRSPSRADISYALTEQLLQLDYLDSAQQVLAEAIQAHSADPLLLAAEADLKAAKGDVEGASLDYRKILSDQPGFTPALAGLARADVMRGNDTEARSKLEAILSDNPDDAAANGELGSLEARLGEWKPASEHLHKAWLQDASNPKTALALSHANRQVNRPSEALKVLTTIGPAMQQSPAFHTELAQVYNQLHRPAEARAELERVSQLQTDAEESLRFDSPKVYVH